MVRWVNLFSIGDERAGFTITHAVHELINRAIYDVAETVHYYQPETTSPRKILREPHGYYSEDFSSELNHAILQIRMVGEVFESFHDRVVVKNLVQVRDYSRLTTQVPNCYCHMMIGNRC